MSINIIGLVADIEVGDSSPNLILWFGKPKIWNYVIIKSVALTDELVVGEEMGGL